MASALFAVGSVDVVHDFTRLITINFNLLLVGPSTGSISYNKVVRKYHNG